MKWFLIDWSTFLTIVLSVVCLLAAVIFTIRLNGLRSLSKMSSIDFAVTIAIGSVIAGAGLSPSTSVLQGATVVAVLVLCQRLIAWARVHTDASKVVDNPPLLLMSEQTMHEDAMASARITPDDIYAKLREANVTDLDQVRAVVLESTGDISVLHGPADERLDERVLQGVIRQ